jgi:predicted O-methyltransferase YrrM
MKTAIENLITSTYNGNTDISQHLLTLFALTVSLKAKNILELGVRDGNSTLAFLLGTKVTNGNLISVDISETPSLRETYKDYKNWNYVISDALLFLEQHVPQVPYDIVFIDDWHDGKHVLKELNYIEKNITTSSLILLHDAMCYNTQPKYHLYQDKDGEFANGGPYGALSQLDKNIWEYSTIPTNNGLTILRKLDQVAIF